MIKAIRGTKDVMPDESARWQGLETAAHDIFKAFGYREIRTPVIEETGLFMKSIGEESDIVKKEMFSFVDRGERNITMRPEGTAPVIRAYLEHNLAKTDPFQKLYYMGPMFRAERPQAGRQRQFHQIGVEAIGSLNPALDAEVIRILVRILEVAGIKQYQVKINNLGCKDDKKKLSAILKESLSGQKASLCEDCKRRVETNPLRVLDCKNPDCKTVVRSAHKGAEFLCDDCKTHFNKVRNFLDLLKIPYTVDPHIVRGLDYYTRTVFEVTHQSLGAQDAIGAGGRYDNLISDMGGPQIGACGFALGVERMLMALDGDKIAPSDEGAVDIFIAALGKGAYEKAFLVLDELRGRRISCDIDYEERSLKAQMRAADKLKAKYVVIIGEDELAKGKAVLRNMATKEQQDIPFDSLVVTISDKLAK